MREVVLVLYAFSGPALWAHLFHEHHNETEHPPAPHEEHDHDSPLHDLFDHRFEPLASPKEFLPASLDLPPDEPVALIEFESARAVAAPIAVKRLPDVCRSRAPPAV